jgi:Tol biopolymer transport system component
MRKTIFWKTTLWIGVCLLVLSVSVGAQQSPINLSTTAKEVLAGKQILYVERHQYAKDHHNTATLFQYGEINEAKFAPGGALKVYDVDSGTTRTLMKIQTGVIRDPEISFDGKRVIFSMRKNREDGYHLYEIGLDGSNLKQLTSAEGVSDIDPLYLPNGDIVFTSTRQPKYCMCNRHIMGNLFRMESDGANITQIGVSTLFEGHSSLLSDGRILYDRTRIQGLQQRPFRMLQAEGSYSYASVRSAYSGCDRAEDNRA